LPVHPYEFLYNLWKTFAPSGRLRLRLCEHKGIVIAGILLFCYKNRVSAEGMAWDEKCGGLSPGHFLFWNAILEARGEGFDVFDFGRTSSVNQSLMDFKNRWGTTVVNLSQHYYPKILGQDSRRTEDHIKYKIFSQLCGITPRAAQEWLGRLAYRHLG